MPGLMKIFSACTVEASSLSLIQKMLAERMGEWLWDLRIRTTVTRVWDVGVAGSNPVTPTIDF
jgi:hypothetical protein